MKSVVAVLAAVAAAFALNALPPRGVAQRPSYSCEVVEQALAASERVKPGVRRGEIERYFVRDRGVAEPGRTRYAHPHCGCLKLTVEYDNASSGAGALPSPDDKVTAKPKLSVERSAKTAQGSAPCCQAVQRALLDSDKLKPGVRRSEVEKYFIQDGGLQFPDKGYYVHPRCNYLKLTIEYDLEPSTTGSPTSPDDRVKNLSALFVERPTKD